MILYFKFPDFSIHVVYLILEVLDSRVVQVILPRIQFLNNFLQFPYMFFLRLEDLKIIQLSEFSSELGAIPARTVLNLELFSGGISCNFDLDVPTFGAWRASLVLLH